MQERKKSKNRQTEIKGKECTHIKHISQLKTINALSQYGYIHLKTLIYLTVNDSLDDF